MDIDQVLLLSDASQTTACKQLSRTFHSFLLPVGGTGNDHSHFTEQKTDSERREADFLAQNTRFLLFSLPCPVDGVSLFVSLFIFCIGVQLLYNVFIMLFFSAVQQSESVICIHIYPPFWIPFPLSSPQSIRYSSQCWAVLCLVTLLCPTLCNPMGWGLPSSSVHGDSPGKNTGVGCHALLQGDLPNPGIEPRSPANSFFTN